MKLLSATFVVTSLLTGLTMLADLPASAGFAPSDEAEIVVVPRDEFGVTAVAIVVR
jgi:hypothetical protein